MLKEAEAYWINFSHYVQLGIQFLEDTKMAIPGVVEAYTRHAAMIGINGQSDWDMIIPIYKSKNGRPGQTDIFDPDNISYIPIRVNNHIGGTKSDATENFAASSLCLPSAKHPSMITIWFDLQGKSSPCQIHTRPPSTRPESSRSGEPAKQLFHLMACGHTGATLKIFSRLQDAHETVSELLGVTDSASLNTSMRSRLEVNGLTCLRSQE